MPVCFAPAVFSVIQAKSRHSFVSWTSIRMVMGGREATRSAPLRGVTCAPMVSCALAANQR